MTNKNIIPTILALSPKRLEKKQGNIFNVERDILYSDYFECFVAGRRFEILDKFPFILAVEQWSGRPNAPLPKNKQTEVGETMRSSRKQNKSITL